jgi:RNA polymerase sigma factor (sigma-70 family)
MYPVPSADAPGSPTGDNLFQKVQEGCRHSLNSLMAEHDGLVQVVVRQQVLGHLPFAEALQAGRIGLWRAILGYDPQRGLAFSTYAWPCIVRHVWRAVKTAQRCAQPGPKKVEEALLASFPHQEPDPFTAWECAARHAALYDLLARLPGRLRHIMVAHYGLADDPPASFRRLGATLGLSAERVRQLHLQALIWLRHPAHSQHLRSLLGRHSRTDYQQARAQAQRWLRQRRGHHGG